MKVHCAVYLRAFEDKTVLLPEFTIDVPHRDSTSTLEHLFRLLNHVMPGDGAKMPTGGKHRSLSMGDLVFLSGGRRHEWWFCDSIGWKQITRDEARELIANPVMKENQ
jgi:hypothetical protein